MPPKTVPTALLSKISSLLDKLLACQTPEQYDEFVSVLMEVGRESTNYMSLLASSANDMARLWEPLCTVLRTPSFYGLPRERQGLILSLLTSLIGDSKGRGVSNSLYFCTSDAVVSRMQLEHHERMLDIADSGIDEVDVVNWSKDTCNLLQRYRAAIEAVSSTQKVQALIAGQASEEQKRELISNIESLKLLCGKAVVVDSVNPSSRQLQFSFQRGKEEGALSFSFLQNVFIIYLLYLNLYEKQTFSLFSQKILKMDAPAHSMVNVEAFINIFALEGHLSRFENVAVNQTVEWALSGEELFPTPPPKMKQPVTKTLQTSAGSGTVKESSLQCRNARQLHDTFTRRVPTEMRFSDNEESNSLRDIDQVIATQRKIRSIPLSATFTPETPVTLEFARDLVFHRQHQHTGGKRKRADVEREGSAELELLTDSRALLPASTNLGEKSGGIIPFETVWKEHFGNKK